MPPITRCSATSRPRSNPRRGGGAGGWGLAGGPRSRAHHARPGGLPHVDPRLALLTRLPATLFAGTPLKAADPTLIASAAEGEYLDLLALTPSNGALLLPGPQDGAIAFVLLFDELFDERIETVRRLHRLIVRRRAPAPSLTAYRRHRLKLALRALDGSLAGADYRVIAEALFGDRVPKGAEFRDASLRAQVIRLARYGIRLMRGGYLDLLRPGHRVR